MGLAAAVGIAEVAFSATAILESVAVVGAAVSVVGAVTKNPVLSQIGMGLGVVGGLGALATSALGLSTTSLFGAAGEAGAGVAGAAEGAVGSAVAGEGGWTVAAPDAVGSLTTEGTAAFDSATQFNTPPMETLGAGVGGDTPTGLINATTSTAEPATGAGGAMDLTDPAATAGGAMKGAATVTPTPAATPATESIAAPVADPPPGTAVGTNGWVVAEPDKGVLGKLMGFVKENPIVGFGALQGASSLLSGWTSTLTPAQVAQLNSQAAQNQAAANLVAQQTANLAMPKAVASSAPVTGTPQPLVPAQQQPGLINQAPAPQAVTGRAA